jgi:hypothetical protein
VDDERRLKAIASTDVGLLVLFGVAVVLLHILVNGRYGFHRDELQTFSNARHLAWGYIEYPPMTAVIGRAELALFGDSLRGFRFFPALTQGLVFVLTGLVARALGAGREAQLIAAIGAVIGGAPLFYGGFLSYTSLDYPCWILVAYLVIRWLRSDDARWCLPIGAAIGLGLMTKYTMAFLVFGLVGGMMLTPARRHFRSRWFWYGLGIAGLIALPNFIWQVKHQFVTLQYLKSIHSRDIRWGWTDYFLLNQLWKAVHPVALPLSCAGLWFFFAAPDGKRYRMVGWMYVLTLLALMLARGRDYYLAPAYPMLIAAGVTHGERWMKSFGAEAQSSVRQTAWWSLAVGGLVTAAVALPVAPIGTAWWTVANAANGNFHYEFGYRELVERVAKIRDALPDNKDKVGILVGDDGQAGAVNLYGAAFGLPEAISGMNSNWLRGYGNPPPQTVIAVGEDPIFLTQNFVSCDRVGILTKPFGIQNHALSFYPELFVCRNPRKPWPELWSHLQYYG